MAEKVHNNFMLRPLCLVSLMDIIIKTVKNKKVLKDWNSGIILSIYKNGDKRNCNNYEGITLLSISGKILERTVDEIAKID